jgi:hypothetical protein
MTEANLKVRHGIDFKRFSRPDNPDMKGRTPAYRTIPHAAHQGVMERHQGPSL